MASKLILLFLLSVILKLSHQIPIQMTAAYDECSQKKARCYDLPHGCLSARNCDALTYVKPTGQGADFQVFWKWTSSNPDRWIGTSVSNDLSMGDDSVIICSIATNNAVSARQGITVAGRVETDYGVKFVSAGINGLQGSYSNGILTCSGSRGGTTTANNINFNIVSTKYYVFMAHGPLTGDAPQTHGDNFWYSLSSDLLANVTIT